MEKTIREILATQSKEVSISFAYFCVYRAKIHSKHAAAAYAAAAAVAAAYAAYVADADADAAAAVYAAAAAAVYAADAADAERKIQHKFLEQFENK